jgi:chemotaxis protein CheY-P-specific phosphatase CheC
MNTSTDNIEDGANNKKADSNIKSNIFLIEGKLKEIEKKASEFAASTFSKLLFADSRVAHVESIVFEHPIVNRSRVLANELLAKYNENAVIVDLEFTREALSKLGRVVAYIDSEQSKKLVDVLLNRLPGTAQDTLDSNEESSITESLNIIGNAYLTAISNNINEKFTAKIPVMLDSARLDGIISDLVSAGEDSLYVLFKNILEVDKSKIEITIFIMIPGDSL